MKQVITNPFTHILQKKRQFLLLLFVLLLVCIGLICWQFIIQTTFYQYLINYYIKFTGQLTVLIANLIGQHVTFEIRNFLLSFNGKFHPLTMPIAAYRFYFIGFILLLIVPFKEYKSSFLLIISSLLFIALRSAIISIIQLIYPQDMILLLWIDPLIYLPMFVIVLFVSKKNKIIKPLYDKTCTLFRPLLNVSFPALIFIFLLATPIPRVVLNYLDIGIIEGLTTMTLEISKVMLKWFGYETVLIANFLFLGKFWLQLEQPCLGIGVVTIVWIMVCFTNSYWLNKSLFLIVFSLLFVIMNSIRLSVLLLIIKQTYLTGINKVELHDNITYFTYLFAFISLLIYYFWFQDIKWRSNKMADYKP